MNFYNFQRLIFAVLPSKNSLPLRSISYIVIVKYRVTKVKRSESRGKVKENPHSIERETLPESERHIFKWEN